jgi:hypothetical protein
MSWHQKAMTGVEDCEKLGEAVKQALIPGQERQMAQSAERRARDVQAMEASARRAQAAPATAHTAAAEEQPAFDPVIDALRSGAPISNAELMRDAQLAFSLTKDRRYIKLVRQLRRPTHAGQLRLRAFERDDSTGRRGAKESYASGASHCFPQSGHRILACAVWSMTMVRRDKH